MGWIFSGLLPDISTRVRELKELPPMPEVAQALLRLKSDSRADAKSLGKVIELDPALSAQIMRYATSALFGYRGKIESIQDAVSRVLGFDRAMHIAIGLASTKALRHTRSGPLGIDQFWRHALYTATLMQALATKMPAQRRPALGIVYLAGMVHDIGHLLLGYLLEAEFDAVNETLARDPQRSVLDIETEVIGVTHCDLGAWLLRKWRMPPEILAAVVQHHNPDFQGEGAAMAQLVLLADRLLTSAGMSDAEATDIPDKTLSLLGLELSLAASVRDQILAEDSGVESLVQQVVQAA